MINILGEIWAELETIDRVNFIGVVVSSCLGLWALLDGALSRRAGELRDQASTYISDFKASIDTIVSTALDYYSLKPDEVNMRHRVDVLTSFSKATSSAKSLQSLSPRLDVRSEVLAFKQLVTGDRWEDAGRTALISGDTYLDQILSDGTALTHKLQASFDRQFFRRRSVLSFLFGPTKFWISVHS